MPSVAKYTVVRCQQPVSRSVFALCKARRMVIFQDTIAHPLPTGDVLGGFDIVCMVWNGTDENDTAFFAQCIVGNAVSDDRVAMVG